MPAPVEETPETPLSAPEQGDAGPLEPASEPVPPELSAFEAIRQAARLLPAQLKLLTVGGRVPLLLYDLNRDGNPEFLAVAVRDGRYGQADIEALSQSSRLFDAEAQPASFALLVYGNVKGSLRKPAVLDLGERRVFESLKRTPLNKNRPVPLIVTVSFLNREGREEELLVFDGPVLRYRTSLAENLAVRSWLEDIDGDGVLDILTRERALEEGIGYETFLSWRRWNGQGFAEVQSRNVLRNLVSFLASLKSRLLEAETRPLLELLAEPKEVQRWKAKGMSEEAVCLYLLGLDRSGLSELPKPNEVVFPEILEDPFIVQDRNGAWFSFTYRLVDENGLVYLPSTRLYMLHNPFGERQFVLRPAGD